MIFFFRDVDLLIFFSFFYL